MTTYYFEKKIAETESCKNIEADKSGNSWRCFSWMEKSRFPCSIWNTKFNGERKKIGKQGHNRGLMITNLLLGRMGKTKFLLCNKLWWHHQLSPDNDPVEDSIKQSCLTDYYHIKLLLRQLPWILTSSERHCLEFKGPQKQGEHQKPHVKTLCHFLYQIMFRSLFQPPDYNPMSERNHSYSALTSFLRAFDPLSQVEVNSPCTKLPAQDGCKYGKEQDCEGKKKNHFLKIIIS